MSDEPEKKRLCLEKRAKSPGPPEQRVITLNVGGVHFTTTTMTLMESGVPLLHNLVSGPYRVIRDDDNVIFLDYDPGFFNLIFNFMRDQGAPLSHLPLHDPKFIHTLEYFGLTSRMLGSHGLRLIGGMTNKSNTCRDYTSVMPNTMATYYPHAHTWAETPFPVRVTRACVGHVGKDIVVAGGLPPVDPDMTMSSWHAYQAVLKIDTYGIISTMAALPEGRFRGNVCSAPNGMVVVGGMTTNSSSPDPRLLYYSNYSKQWVSKSIAEDPGVNTCGTMIGDSHLFVASGSTGKVTQYSLQDDFKTVSTVQVVPESFCEKDNELRSICVCHETAIYFITNSRMSVMMRYDTETGDIERLPGPPFPTTEGAAAIMCNHIFYTGGWFSGQLVSDATQVYNIDKQEWTFGKSLPQPRWGHSIVSFELH